MVTVVCPRTALGFCLIIITLFEMSVSNKKLFIILSTLEVALVFRKVADPWSKLRFFGKIVKSMAHLLMLKKDVLVWQTHNCIYVGILIQYNLTDIFENVILYIMFLLHLG